MFAKNKFRNNYFCFCNMYFSWRHDIQYNNIQHDDIHPTDTQQKDTQGNGACAAMLSVIYPECCYAEGYKKLLLLSVIMLSVIMLNVIMLFVMLPFLIGSELVKFLS